MRKAAENLEFEEAARMRDEIKRLETVELAVADDPLARQSAVEAAVEDSARASGRSTAGRPGQRGGKARRGRAALSLELSDFVSISLSNNLPKLPSCR